MTDEKSLSAFDRFAAVAVLTALGATWPVLDLLGRNAEFFVARRSTKWEIVAVGVALAIVLPVLAGGLAALPGRIGSILSLGLIGVMGASLAQLYLRRLPILWWVTTALAVLLGAAGAWAFRRFDPARLFARYLSPVPLVFVLVFLFTTPVGAVLADEGAEIGSPVTVATPTPIVMIVFDEFPVASIIDPSGELRRDRYPNLARLADDATWYRNAVTVEQQTEHSVPAMLTGEVPDQSLTPYAGQYPDNLFTALQDGYQLEVLETITQLCPRSLCEGLGQSSTPIVRDVGIVAGHLLLPDGLSSGLPQIDRGWGDFGAATSDFDVVAEFRENFEADPRRPIEAFIDSFRAPNEGDRPGLYFLHAVVPHHPWQFLPDGRRYPLVSERAPGSDSPGWGPDTFLVAQAMQRHLLQVGYVDHALGEIVNGLEEAGIYDDAMIVLVADHGISVKPNVPHQRQISEDTVGEIAAVPLFVKLPGQHQGAIDDRRALTVDILPTIADVIGADIPWDVDGASLLEPPEDRVESTTIGPYSVATYGSDGTEKLAAASRIEELFPGGDPWALRPEDAPELVGSAIDPSTLGAADFVWNLDRPLAYTSVTTEGDVIPARITGAIVGDQRGRKVLAVAVNGIVGAMTRSYLEEGEEFFQVMVPPDAFASGYNEIDLVWVDSDGATRLVEQANRP